MEDCNQEIPSGAPAISYYSYRNSNATVTIKKGGGPRTGFLLEYGPSCDNLSQSANIDGGATTHTLSGLSFVRTACFRIREENGCAVGAWSKTFNAAAPPVVHLGRGSTSSNDPTATNGGGAALPVSGTVSSIFILMLGISCVVASVWWFRRAPVVR